MSMNSTSPEAVEDCRGYLSSPPSGSSYLWEFEGIPFNLFLNTLSVPICLLLWQAMKYAMQILRKNGYLLFSLNIEEKGHLPKMTFRRFFFMENWELAQRAGLDGVAYMSALVHNMYQLISMLPFVIIGLPIYYYGGKLTSTFARLSIINLSLNDTYRPWILWSLALGCCVLYFIWTAVRFEFAYHWPKASGICRAWNVGAHGSDNRQSLAQENGSEEDASAKVSSTMSCQCFMVNQLPNVLMLSDVPNMPLSALEKELQTYFTSFDPPVNVRWVRPLSNDYHLVIRERIKLETEELEKIVQREFERTNQEPRYSHGLCGCGNCLRHLRFGCCCCPCVQAAQNQSDFAREIYRDRLAADKIWLDAQYSRLEDSVQNQSRFTTGVVFVGLDSAVEALRVAKEFSIYLQRAIPTDYTIHPQTHVPCLFMRRWSNMLIDRKRAHYFASARFGHLQLAPLPAEILWTNLMTSRYRSPFWWFIQVCKSIGIFFAALLLTSPTYLLLTLNYLRSQDWITKRIGIFVFQWVPALVLVSAAALVKQLVILSETWTKHGTYGGQEKVGQRTLSLFLLISVLIFPSLGVTGLPFLIERLVGHPSDKKPMRLECIFLPDSAALFINYVITSALLGSAVQLLQLGRWFWFLTCRIFCVHSSAEARYLAQTNAGPFPFRERYASMNLINAIVISYTPIAPIILPFGLLYFVCDYLICRYAMLYIYASNWFDDGHELYPRELYEQADRVYHLTWFSQSNNLNMAGICLACLNMSFFFAFRLSVASSRPVAIAFFLLAALVITICILCSALMDGRCYRPGDRCMISRLCKESDKDEEQLIKSSTEESSMIDGTGIFSERLYTPTYFGQSRLQTP